MRRMFGQGYGQSGYGHGYNQGGFGPGGGGYGGPGGPGGAFGGRDSHTRVAYQRNAGYFERVGGSFCGICFGVFVIAAACFVIFWNEVGVNVSLVITVLFIFLCLGSSCADGAVIGRRSSSVY